MKLIEGDLLTITDGIIIHQVNCQGVMGSGVAKALSTKYPIVKKQYLKKFKQVSRQDLIGIYQFVDISDTLQIVNSFTQDQYGYGRKQTDEQKLIQNIVEICHLHNDKTVYVPHLIGCGLAGGDWNVILSGIQHLENLVIVQLSDNEKRRRGLVV